MEKGPADPLLELVSEFLGARGFEQASDALRAESSTDGRRTRESRLEKVIRRAQMLSGGSTDMILSSTLDARGSQNPTLFAESFSTYQDWAAASLERFRPELACVSFPLFVHCFLKILQLHPEESQARSFFNRWCNDFRLTNYREVQALSTLTGKADLEGDEYARSLLGPNRARFRVSLAKATFELLISFLTTSDLLLLVDLLNTYVSVSVQDRDPDMTIQASNLAAPGPSQPQDERVAWRTLSLPVANPQGEGSTPEDFPSLQHSQSDAPGQAGLLPRTGDQFNSQLLGKCMRHLPPAFPAGGPGAADLTREPRSELADASAPSVLMTTVLNAYQGMTSSQFTRDATRFAASFSDRLVRVWSLGQGQAAGGETAGAREEAGPVELRFHSHSVFSVSWSPEHRHLISGAGDGAICLWDLATAKAVACYRGHACPVWDAQFSPVGHYFVSASFDRTARLWSTDQAQPLRIFAGHYADVTCAAFHPNCNYVITGSTDRTARLWDLQSGKCLRIFAGHLGSIATLSVCPDGRYLATGSDDGTARIWDIPSGEQVALLEEHSAAIHSLDFSADGGTLATGSADCSVRIWDIAGSFGSALARTEEKLRISSTKRFWSKNTPICSVTWTRRNLLLAAGAFDVQHSLS